MKYEMNILYNHNYASHILKYYQNSILFNVQLKQTFFNKYLEMINLIDNTNNIIFKILNIL